MHVVVTKYILIDTALAHCLTSCKIRVGCHGKAKDAKVDPVSGDSQILFQKRCNKIVFRIG